MGEAMAEGDVVTRLDDRVADVVADRAVPGPEPALDPPRVASLIPGDTSDNDELAAISGIKSASLLPQPD